ncbi:MAG: 2-oxo acid dehydrogenase subunit E2 [Treponema sp.]|jgi:pyruvate dehydrogenase E2 component (dihydrolipoamide acetyltransferase)|nr:2-oxo acid dehydrogenase subunit E2 [Treponema sp.]
MAHVLIMPRQGNTVESCILVDWKVKEGDAVAADTPVCVVETDKATFEIPAGMDGTILKLLWAAGDDVPVLEPVAVLGNAGEDWQAVLEKAGRNVGSGSDKAAETTAPSPASPDRDTASSSGHLAVSPRARHAAEKAGLPLEGISGSGPGGRIIEGDVQAALHDRPALTAAARAALSGGTLPAEGLGLAGRLTEADIAAAANQTGIGAKPGGIVTENPPPATLPDLHGADWGEGTITETPVKGIRKLIANRMRQSLAESAQFTLNAAAPVLRLQEIRERMKTGDESLGLSKITVNDLILFGVSRILPRFPFMNAHKIGDTLRTFERVHLGVAVDTPRGLMVPVIRNANLLSLKQISTEAKRLATACQTGGIKPEELSGSTFTVTNLGSLGVTAFTPVLNTPEVAILGVCGIELKPVALPSGEQSGTVGYPGVKFEPHIGFSLTINHEVVDGAPAARFLSAVSKAIADIDLWLVNN